MHVERHREEVEARDADQLVHAEQSDGGGDTLHAELVEPAARVQHLAKLARNHGRHPAPAQKEIRKVLRARSAAEEQPVRKDERSKYRSQGDAIDGYPARARVQRPAGEADCHADEGAHDPSEQHDGQRLGRLAVMTGDAVPADDPAGQVAGQEQRIEAGDEADAADGGDAERHVLQVRHHLRPVRIDVTHDRNQQVRGEHRQQVDPTQVGKKCIDRNFPQHHAEQSQ